jgi:histone H3/H4
MERQWRLVIGPTRVIRQGLDQTPVHGLMKTLGIKKRNRRSVLESLREMETTAMVELAKADE